MIRLSLTLRNFIVICLVFIVSGLMAAGANQSDFLSDGRIVSGSKSIRMTPEGQIILTVDNNEVIIIDQQMSLGGIKWTYTPNFTSKSFKVYKTDKKCVFKGKIPLGKVKKGLAADFLLTMKLRKDGTIDIERQLTKPSGVKTRYDNTFFIFPFHLLSGQTVVIDGNPLKIKRNYDDAEKRVLILKHSKNIKTMNFFPADADKKFKLKILDDWRTFIRYSSGGRGKQVFVGLASLNGCIKFSLDLSGGRKLPMKASRSNIDFQSTDHLTPPNYFASGNLIQNPSFEQGLHYYQYRSYAKPVEVRYKWYYKLDNKNARFGQNSLMIRALKKLKDPLPIGTFVIPVEANQDYTFSFYAKSDNKLSGLVLKSLTARHPQFADYQGKGYKYFPMTSEWKRYSVKVRNPNTGLAILFQAKLDPRCESDEARIWIDGLQLEKGNTLSDFTCRPVWTKFQTASKGDFIAAGSRFAPELLIGTIKPETSGTAQVTIKDFFSQTVFSKQYPFKAKSGKDTVIALPELENRLKNKKGIFVVKVSVRTADGVEDYDFFRFSIMKFLDNKFKNKNTFAFCLQYLLPRPDIADVLERFRMIGWGGCNYGLFGPDIAKLLKRNNIKYFGEYMARKRKANGSIAIDGKIMMSGINKLKDVTPEISRKVEELCYQKAKFYPDIKMWFFDGECATGMMSNLQENIENFAQLLIATYRGVKRFNPDAKVLLTGGPCNMMPQGGTRLVAKYIDAIKGRVKFDAVAIHPYRATPEVPDMDSDAKYFLEMLDKKGYGDVPVYWNEGMHFPQYNVPDWGLNPYRGNSNDHFYAGALSYDMGWGEKISAAFYTRGWLVALKYQDRVKMFDGWQHRESFMDTDLTPYAIQKATNTMGNILGNAVFKKDIRFAENSRCYVFEDENKRPVAVIWSYYPEVDRNKQRPPKAMTKFTGGLPEFIDLMGNPRKVTSDNDGRVQIELSPFPLFIRGRAGTMKSFCDDLAKTSVKGVENLFIKVAAKPLAGNRVEVSFHNPLTRDFKGSAVLKINRKEYRRMLDLKAMATSSMVFPLESNRKVGGIHRIDIPCVVTGSNGESMKQKLAMDFFCVGKRPAGQSIKIDGKLDDWTGIPEIPVVNSVVNVAKAKQDPEKIGYPGDFAAEFKITWDEANLYIAAKVVDDVFTHDKTGHVSQRWNNDCLQVYLDTMCDARSKTIKGFDTNDYDYDFFPNEKTGDLSAFRRFAPEQQAAGGLFAPKPNEIEPNIKTAFCKTSDGYIYEIAIPRKYIAPMRLEADSIVGFGIFFSDRDKGVKRKKASMVKRSLTITPPGTGCYMNPHLYPVMLLVK